MQYIDLRSDTVTLPTEEMRVEMAKAPVGDDVYGDDPTINRLEELAAKMVGKEAALFVPSGTFGNQLCIMTHTGRGDEIILGEDCHVVMHEVGGPAVLAGVQLRTLPSHNGILDPSRVRKAIREEDIHYPKTGLICLENAHGLGTVIPLENMREIKSIAKEHGLPVHLDGARIFNAAAVLRVPAEEIAACCDSVMFCLSKGLAAPVGSMVAGTRAFVEKARKLRKLMGGGMRQAGILAAAGIVALEKMTTRLKEDHENAEHLARRLGEIDGLRVCRERRDINMVFFQLAEEIIPGERLVQGLLRRGIKICEREEGEYRFVTNVNVSRENIDFVVDMMKEMIGRY